MYYQCRRKFQIEAYDDRDVVENVVVFDPSKDYTLFDNCRTCGYGKKAWILKTGKAPFDTFEIKACNLRKKDKESEGLNYVL